MTRPKLVMLRPLGLGDLLTGVPAMRAVARRFPNHHRLLAMPLPLAPLAMLSGAIDEVVAAQPLQPLPAVCEAPDVAIDLHGRGPESHRVLLDTRPKRLIAFANGAIPQSQGFPQWRPEEHEVHRWCRLLSESGVPADPTELDLPRPSVTLPSWAREAVVIHPGAGYPARRWPADRWAAVARALGPAVVITGNASERDLAHEVAALAGLGPDRVLAGRTGILELTAIVAAARMVICPDTGIGHLATAMRTPSVILFGPSSPATWGPPPDRPWHRAIWKGSLGDPNGHTPDAGLLAISVDEVLNEIEMMSEMRHAVRA